MTDPVDIKHIGKFIEELNELAEAAARCSTAAARCLIQGIDEREPSTEELNRDWLQKEIADVLCNIELVAERFSLDWSMIKARKVMKREHLKKWHNHA